MINSSNISYIFQPSDQIFREFTVATSVDSFSQNLGDGTIFTCIITTHAKALVPVHVVTGEQVLCF